MVHLQKKKRFNLKLELRKNEKIFRITKNRGVSRTFAKSKMELFVTKVNG